MHVCKHSYWIQDTVGAVDSAGDITETSTCCALEKLSGTITGGESLCAPLANITSIEALAPSEKKVGVRKRALN